LGRGAGEVEAPIKESFMNLCANFTGCRGGTGAVLDMCLRGAGPGAVAGFIGGLPVFGSNSIFIFPQHLNSVITSAALFAFNNHLTRQEHGTIDLRSLKGPIQKREGSQNSYESRNIDSKKIAQSKRMMWSFRLRETLSD
jgi:hypothetical protein